MAFGRRKNQDVISPTTTNATYTDDHVTKARPSINFILASLLTLAGALLLWLAAFSAPFIKRIYYVGLDDRNVGDKLGTFGYCVGRGFATGCSKSMVGYTYPLVPSSKGLTGSLIITAIAAGLASLAFFSLLFAIIKRRTGGFPSFLLTLLSALLALISFVLALVAFVTFHRRAGRNQLGPHYGPAMWLHLVGTALLLAAVPLTLLGWIRQRKHKNVVHVAPKHETTYIPPRSPATYVAPAPVAPRPVPVVAPAPVAPRVVPVVAPAPVVPIVAPVSRGPVDTVNHNVHNTHVTRGPVVPVHTETDRYEREHVAPVVATTTTTTYNNYSSNNYSTRNNGSNLRNVPLAPPIDPVSDHVDLTHPNYVDNPTFNNRA